MPKIPPPQGKLNRPEALVQARLIKMLTAEGWYVKETHGNWFQSGFPDLYAVHPAKGSRWIEVKEPNRPHGRSIFTPAQLETFTRWHRMGLGVWVLVAADAMEYSKLSRPPNWMAFL